MIGKTCPGHQRDDKCDDDGKITETLTCPGDCTEVIIDCVCPICECVCTCEEPSEGGEEPGEEPGTPGGPPAGLDPVDAPPLAPVPPAAPAAPATTVIEDDDTPLAGPVAASSDTPAPPSIGGGDSDPTEPADEITIPDNIVPLAAQIGSSGGQWALWNLILSIAGVALAVMMGIRIFMNKRNEETDEETGKQSAKKRNRLLMLLAIPVLAIVEVVLFLLTEDMRLAMTLTDLWTIPHAILFAAGLLCYISMSKKESEDNDEGQLAGGVA